MGFRFQKRITILPGLRINLSKSGASLSAGPRGASVNIGKRGVYGTAGIPGTGLSYRERLDKPKPRSAPQARDPGLEMPERVIARLVANEVQLFDPEERPLDPTLHPAAKRLMKDDVKRFLEEHAAERNNALDHLRQLHRDIPASLGVVPSSTHGKPRSDQYASHSDYMQALMTWRAEAANSGPDTEAIETALLETLGALEWPAETNIAISMDGGRLLLDVDLPEIEDMPAARWMPLMSKMSLVEKPISQKDLAGLYLDHVYSVIARLVGHSMAVSGAIETVAISAYTQRSASSGKVDDEYVAAVEVEREEWNEIDTSAMASIDPYNLLRRLGAKIDTNSRGMLLVQQPLS